MDRLTLTDKDAQGITINGKPILKSAKVTKSLEEALADVKLEWIEE